MNCTYDSLYLVGYNENMSQYSKFFCNKVCFLKKETKSNSRE